MCRPVARRSGSQAAQLALSSVRAGSVSHRSSTGTSGRQRSRGRAGHGPSGSRSWDHADGQIRLWSRRAGVRVPSVTQIVGQPPSTRCPRGSSRCGGRHGPRSRETRRRGQSGPHACRRPRPGSGRCLQAWDPCRCKASLGRRLGGHRVAPAVVGAIINPAISDNHTVITAALRMRSPNRRKKDSRSLSRNGQDCWCYWVRVRRTKSAPARSKTIPATNMGTVDAPVNGNCPDDCPGVSPRQPLTSKMVAAGDGCRSTLS
jgi:hypothetical protein